MAMVFFHFVIFKNNKTIAIRKTAKVVQKWHHTIKKLKFQPIKLISSEVPY